MKSARKQQSEINEEIGLQDECAVQDKPKLNQAIANEPRKRY